VLSLTSIPVPPELLERLRLAASRLGLRHGVIAAAAIDRFLAEYGF
jgi:predicted DNA-binding protein